jgi:integrase
VARRRHNSEGTEWYEEASKRWRWRIRWEGKNHYVSNADRSRAKADFEALVKKLKAGTIDQGTQTLRTFLAYWLDSVVQREVGGSTYVDYKKRIEIYITPTLGDYELRQLTGKIIRAWVNAVRDAYALSSAKQALAILKRALDTAVEDGALEENPARMVAPPKAPRQAVVNDDDEDGGRSLSAEAADRVIAEAKRCDKLFSSTYGKRSEVAAVRGDGIYPLYLLAIRLGLRRGELLGLRWKDVDFDLRIIRVRQQVVRTDGEYYISSTLKTPKARRDLPLTDDLIAVLRELKLKLGPRAHVKGLVFPDKEGNERDPNAVSRNFNRMVKRLDLGNHHFHDLRATCITLLRARGIQAEVVAAIAGHEKPDVTLEVYTDVDMGRKRLAMGG